jgi:hypothetical protein
MKMSAMGADNQDQASDPDRVACEPSLHRPVETLACSYHPLDEQVRKTNCEEHGYRPEKEDRLRPQRRAHGKNADNNRGNEPVDDAGDGAEGNYDAKEGNEEPCGGHPVVGACVDREIAVGGTNNPAVESRKKPNQADYHYQ